MAGYDNLKGVKLLDLNHVPLEDSHNVIKSTAVTFARIFIFFAKIFLSMSK